jgi:hypothetical protein
MDMREYSKRSEYSKRAHPAEASRAMAPSVAPALPPAAALPPIPDAWSFKQGATRWARPEPALAMAADSAAPALSRPQVQQWTEEGYVVVHGLWPAPLIAEAVAQLHAAVGAGQALGGFPYGPELGALNRIILHARVLRAAEQCLRTSDLRFSGGGLMHKRYQAPAAGAHGERPDFAPGEQGLHQVMSQRMMPSHVCVMTSPAFSCR